MSGYRSRSRKQCEPVFPIFECPEAHLLFNHQLSMLKRLQTFTQETVTSPTHPNPVPNDPIIRKLALLSLLAVFKDIAPGYRIRVARDVEKAQKVSQVVLHQREFEEGLLVAYQAYLKTLERQLKGQRFVSLKPMNAYGLPL